MQIIPQDVLTGYAMPVMTAFGLGLATSINIAEVMKFNAKANDVQNASVKAAALAVVTLVDRLLKGFGLTDKNYLSNALIACNTSEDLQGFFFSTSKNTIPNTDHSVFNALAGVVSLAATKFLGFDLTGDFESYTANTWDSYYEMARALPNSQGQITLLTGVNVAAQLGITALVENFVDKMWHDRDEAHRTHNYKGGFGIIMDGMPGFIATRVLEAFWNNFFTKKLAKGVADEFKQELIPELFDNVVARAVISDPALRGAIDEIPGLQVNIANNIQGIASYLNQVNGFLWNFHHINQTLPGLPCAILMMMSLFEKVYQKTIGYGFEKLYDEKSKAKAELGSYFESTISNMKVIREKNTQEAIQTRLFELLGSHDDFEQQKNWMKALSRSYWVIFGMAINEILWHKANDTFISEREGNIRDLSPIWYSNNTIYKFSESMSNTEGENENLKAIKKAREMLEKLRALKQHNLDYSYKKSDDPHEKSLKIGTLKIQYGNDVVLDIQRPMVLTPGIYAMVAPSGSGKSTVLEALKLGREAIASIVGEVTTPGSGDIFMFSQTDFILGDNLTLLELLCHPVRITPENKMMMRMKAKTFLDSLRMGDQKASDTISRLIERFDEQRYDWREVLSGGEKKIVQMCNFHIQTSDGQYRTLFLDEPLNGLSPELVLQVMKGIKQNFSGAIVVIVTHQHQMQNDLYKKDTGENFFDGILHLENQNLSLE